MLVAVVTAGASQPGPTPLPAPAIAAAPELSGGPLRWQWPLEGPHLVLRPFKAPPSAYGSGHRGVDLGGAPGAEVRAVAAGVVTHSGVIAGRGTVTIEVAEGLRVTYEPLASRPARGEQVVAGERIGTLKSVGSHCGPTACLHLGVLRDGVYLDPLVWFGAGRVVLLPLSGAQARG